MPDLIPSVVQCELEYVLSSASVSSCSATENARGVDRISGSWNVGRLPD